VRATGEGVDVLGGGHFHGGLPDLLLMRFEDFVETRS
jgi:hypothetical protein